MSDDPREETSDETPVPEPEDGESGLEGSPEEEGVSKNFQEREDDPLERAQKEGGEESEFDLEAQIDLDLEEPCGTFRESRPEGLVPPRQPMLLLRPPRWADRNVGAS